MVLDQFAGGGTTLVEAKLLNRDIIGVDVNDIALERCREKVSFEHEGATGKVYIRKGDARNLDFTIYRKLIQSAKDSGDYDFIIVDVEAGYSRWRIQLLQDSDKVMLITLQDDVSTNKMRYITECLDFGDHEKYMVICNKYSETRDNQYVQSGLQSEFSIREYIDEVSTPLLTARQLAQLNGIEKVSYMFI